MIKAEHVENEVRIRPLNQISYDQSKIVSNTGAINVVTTIVDAVLAGGLHINPVDPSTYGNFLQTDGAALGVLLVGQTLSVLHAARQYKNLTREYKSTQGELIRREQPLVRV